MKFTNNNNFPSNINKLLNEKIYITENIGMSQSKILIFEDMVLKIEPNILESQNEIKIMKWIENNKYFPKLIINEIFKKKSYLIMTRIKGKMACDEIYMNNGDILIKALVDGLKFLWNFNITNCPFIQTVDDKIKQIEIKINKGLININNINLDFFFEEKFENVKELFNWLINHRTKEEFVLSHGDYCLPNIFIENNIFSGFVDIGKLGIADKWLDLAICYRSLKYNIEGKYNGKKYNIDPNLLFIKLDIKPNWDKIKFYILLDELL